MDTTLHTATWSPGAVTTSGGSCAATVHVQVGVGDTPLPCPYEFRLQYLVRQFHSLTIIDEDRATPNPSSEG